MTMHKGHTNILKRVTFFILLAGYTLTLLQAAEAQPLPNDCLASFKTKADKFIVYYGWLPGGGGVVNAMTCTRAEALREQLFRPDGATAFSDADIKTALGYDSPAERAKELLQRKINELLNDKPSDFRLWFDAQMLAISRTQILIACLAIETGAGAGLCGLGVLQLVVSAYDLRDKLPGGPAEAQRNALIADMKKVISYYDKAIADGATKKNPLEKAKQLLNSAQFGLCIEIKKSCL